MTGHYPVGRRFRQRRDEPAKEDRRGSRPRQLGHEETWHVDGPGIAAYSAGSRPSGRVNPKAIESMAELGYDLARHGSKGLIEIPDVTYDAVITTPRDACPFVAAKRREDWQIPDPRERAPGETRRVRDLIEAQVKGLLATVG